MTAITAAPPSSYLTNENTIRSWLFTIDDKRIALLYFGSITSFFLGFLPRRLRRDAGHGVVLGSVDYAMRAAAFRSIEERNAATSPPFSVRDVPVLGGRSAPRLPSRSLTWTRPPPTYWSKPSWIGVSIPFSAFRATASTASSRRCANTRTRSASSRCATRRRRPSPPCGYAKFTGRLGVLPRDLGAGRHPSAQRPL